MRTVIGVFRNQQQAENAKDELKHILTPAEHIQMLRPDRDRLRYDSAHVTDTVDRRGFGISIGAIVLGAAALIVSLIIFGSPWQENWTGLVSPVIAVLVIGGALAGAAIGARVTNPSHYGAVQGISQEDFFYYHDALQRGNYLINVTATTAEHAAYIASLLTQFGAESHDLVRERWWAELSSTEASYYQDNELVYRAGFEAALSPELMGRNYQDALPMLRARYNNDVDQELFRRGYERGQLYVSRQHLGHDLRRAA